MRAISVPQKSTRNVPFSEPALSSAEITKIYADLKPWLSTLDKSFKEAISEQNIEKLQAILRGIPEIARNYFSDERQDLSESITRRENIGENRKKLLVIDQKVKKLTEKIIDDLVDGVFSSSTTEKPLIMAVRLNNLPIVKILVQYGIHSSIKSEALVKTLEERKFDIFKYLIQIGINLNIYNFDPSGNIISYLINTAMTLSDTRFYDLLLDFDARINLTNNAENSILMIAIENWIDIAQIGKLLHKGVNLSYYNKHGITILKLLDDQKFTIKTNIKDNQEDLDQLRQLEQWDDNLEQIDQLIRQSITLIKDVNPYDAYPEIPITTYLMVVSETGNLSVIKGWFSQVLESITQNIYDDEDELIEASNRYIRTRETINQTDRNGDTAMHYAVRSGNPDLIRFLMTQGGDLMKENLEGISPFDLLMNLRDSTKESHSWKKLFNKITEMELQKTVENVRLAVPQPFRTREGILPAGPGRSVREAASENWQFERSRAPEYLAEIQRMCANPSTTRYSLLDRANQLGLDITKLQNLSKERICSTMENFIRLQSREGLR